MSVELLCYQRDLDIRGLPVKVRDARTFLNEDDFTKLLEAGVALPVVADFIRCKAAAVHGGWVVDADVLWLKEPPVVEACAPKCGHLFASCKACWHFRNKQDEARHWQVHYLKTPHDRLVLATPWFFSTMQSCVG
jgi:hypothetical protein